MNSPSRYRIIAHSNDVDDAQKYGIPELKKFPMPDAKHVRSAIKFFNYVTPAHEKQLANAILKRMREYGMSFDDFEVGEENRFSKYIPKHLEHHGILGQKWGVRRYQNEDGSLTSTGKKRYSSDSSSVNTRTIYRPGKVERTSSAIKDTKNGRSNSNKQRKYSHKPNKEELNEWLKKNFIGFNAQPEYLQKEIDYLNTYSDYDGLTVGERMMMDEEEYELFQKMSYEEQKKYLQELRARQINYLDKNVTTDNFNTDHADGKYGVFDKLREHVTGRLDADNAQNVRNNIVNNQKQYLRAETKWGEEQEARLQRQWTQEKVDTVLAGKEASLLRNRGRRLAQKIVSKLR